MYRLFRFASYNPKTMATFINDINSVSETFHKISDIENISNFKNNLSYELNRINSAIAVNTFRQTMQISLAKHDGRCYMEIVGHCFHMIYRKEDA